METVRCPGTHLDADPMYKVDRARRVAVVMAQRRDQMMTHTPVGIDVSKATPDVSAMTAGKPLGRMFTNTEAGYSELIG